MLRVTKLRAPAIRVLPAAELPPAAGLPADPVMAILLIPPGTRQVPRLPEGRGASVYVVSGEAEVRHGPRLARRSPVRAGDVLHVPAGTRCLMVNHGGVTLIGVVAAYSATAHPDTDHPGAAHPGAAHSNDSGGGQAHTR